MPVPTPKPNESERDFLSRCMGDKTMIEEYKRNQRFVICLNSLKKN